MLAPTLLKNETMFLIQPVKVTPASTVSVGSTKNGGIKVVAPTIPGYTLLCPVGFYIDKTALAISRFQRSGNNVWLVFRNAATSSVSFGNGVVDFLYVNNDLVNTNSQINQTMSVVNNSTEAGQSVDSAIWAAT